MLTKVLAGMVLAGALLLGCWTSERQVFFPHITNRGKNSPPPKRYPTRIRSRDCLAALERLAAFESPYDRGEFARCNDEPDENWYECAFRVREPAWYELNRYAYEAVDECAPEAWKAEP